MFNENVSPVELRESLLKMCGKRVLIRAPLGFLEFAMEGLLEYLGNDRWKATYREDTSILFSLTNVEKIGLQTTGGYIPTLIFLKV